VTRGRAVLLVVALAACAGCLRRAAPGAAGPPVDYVRRSFQSSLAGCTDPTTGAPVACVELEIDYVDATRATVALTQAVARFVGATALRPIMGDGAPQSVEDLREEVYEAYRERQQDGLQPPVPWRLKRSVKVACNTKQVQGLVATEQSWTAGGRTIERVAYRSFDTETGARIGLDTLAAPEQRDQLAAELARRLRGTPGGGAGQGLWDRSTADTATDRVELGDDVLACPDAITVRSSDGTVETAVPRGELKGLLLPDTP
jgi:hypothetical protein